MPTHLVQQLCCCLNVNVCQTSDIHIWRNFTQGPDFWIHLWTSTHNSMGGNILVARSTNMNIFNINEDEYVVNMWYASSLILNIFSINEDEYVVCYSKASSIPIKVSRIITTNFNVTKYADAKHFCKYHPRCLNTWFAFVRDELLKHILGVKSNISYLGP